jgi:hypothetical protein
MEMKNGLVNNKGHKEWYLNGELHRTDGPAAESRNGDKYWYLNGQPHRLDGPAVLSHSGYKEWWLDGQQFNNEEDYNEVLNQVRNMSDAERLTDPRDWVREWR